MGDWKKKRTSKRKKKQRIRVKKLRKRKTKKVHTKQKSNYKKSQCAPKKKEDYLDFSCYTPKVLLKMKVLIHINGLRNFQ